jgi:CheY-like chemotaxis protein
MQHGGNAVGITIYRRETYMESTILLVDDVQMFIEIEKDFFQRSPVKILTAKDGSEALQAVKCMQPDLVFMDLQMPKMDGASCCRAIKADASLNRTPVILISSSSKEEDRAQCITAGCNHFLTKPLDRDRFLEVGRKYVPSIDRREKRVQCRIDAVISVNGAVVPCCLVNLSVGGAYVATHISAKPKDVLQISFSLPGGNIVDCHGRIVWLNNTASKQRAGCGIRFSLIKRGAMEALAKFIG